MHFNKLGTFIIGWVLLPLLSFSQTQTFSGWDWDLLRSAEKSRTISKTHFYKTISNLSDPVALGIPASLYIVGLANKNEAMKKQALYIGESFAASAIITHAMKKMVNRYRPIAANPNFTALVDVRTQSFPSGHTSEAFTMATSVSLAYPKWYVIAPAYTFATLVGYSRIYLGVHYPSDVVAGAILGSGTAYLTYKANRWLTKKKSERRKK